MVQGRIGKQSRRFRAPQRIALDEGVGGKAEMIVELADHAQRQRALARHDLGDASAIAQDRLQVGAVEPALFHRESHQRDRIGRVDAVVLRFISFDKRG